MKKLKAFLPISVLGLSFAMVLWLVMHQNFLYGGYEGLLYNGLKPIMNGEAFGLNGQLILSPAGEQGEIMKMTIEVVGFVDPSSKTGEVELNLIQPLDGENIHLASIVQDEEALWLMPAEAEQVDISGLLMDHKLSEEQKKNDWVDFFESLTITEVADFDPRADKGHLKNNLVNYHLNLLSLLEVEQLNAFEDVLGFAVSEGMEMGLDLQMDNRGQLAAVRLQANTKVFDVSGWLTLVEDE